MEDCPPTPSKIPCTHSSALRRTCTPLLLLPQHFLVLAGHLARLRLRLRLVKDWKRKGLMDTNNSIAEAPCLRVSLGVVLSSPSTSDFCGMGWGPKESRLD